MKISCLVVDDEPMARKGLKGYIEKIDFLDYRGQCEDALQLSNLLKESTVDLLFLDIEMPYLSGIDYLKNTPHPPKVIFTTAYERYAINGYELDVLDYLLKPISFDRFLKSCNKAFDFFNQRSGQSDYLFIKADNRLEKIFLDDILFVEAMENYVGIYLPNKKMVTHSTLRALYEKLPAQQFIQPHKSYLVNVNKISAIEGNTMMIDQYQVPISKYQKEEVMEKIVNHKLLNK